MRNTWFVWSLALTGALHTSFASGVDIDDLRPGLRTTAFRRRVTIAFHITEMTVTIDRVLYGGRDLKPMFDDENAERSEQPVDSTAQ